MSEINTKLMLKEIEDRLTDVNTGSYVAYDCGEDYFDDAENIDEVIEQIENYCDEYNNGNITIKELNNNILKIEVIWDTSPMPRFCSFKERFEPLKETISWWTIEDLKRYVAE